MWIEQGPGTPIAPEIQPELQQIILEFALLEDVTGPMCSTVDRDKYVAGTPCRHQVLLLEDAVDGGEGGLKQALSVMETYFEVTDSETAGCAAVYSVMGHFDSLLGHGGAWSTSQAV
jgi:hypothetical protein